MSSGLQEAKEKSRGANKCNQLLTRMYAMRAVEAQIQFPLRLKLVKLSYQFLPLPKDRSNVTVVQRGTNTANYYR